VLDQKNSTALAGGLGLENESFGFALVELVVEISPLRRQQPGWGEKFKVFWKFAFQTFQIPGEMVFAGQGKHSY
jgi:hypothetical protein